MPRILFASNNVSHFPGSQPGNTAGTFDPLRVPYSVQMTNYQLIAGPQFTPSPGNTTWFHFRVHSVGATLTAPANNPGVLLQCQDSLNRLSLQILRRNSDWTQGLVLSLLNGDTVTNVVSLLPIAIERMNFIDVSLTITASLIEATLYVNGGFGATAVYNANPNDFTKPIFFSLGASHAASLGNPQCFSEIIVSDGDTRNARLNLLRPITAGTFAQWDGLLSALGDDDPTSGLYTSVAAERHSAALSEYLGAQNLSNVVSVSMTTRGLNSPTGIRHMIRQAAVNYDSPTLAVPFNLQYNIHDNPGHPGTNLPWTSTQLNTLEVGVLSMA